MLGPGDGYIKEPPFFFHGPQTGSFTGFVVCAGIFQAPGVGNDPLFRSGDKHHRKFQAFGSVDCHDIYFALFILLPVVAGTDKTYPV